MVQGSGDAITCGEGEALVSVVCNGSSTPRVSEGRTARCSVPDFDRRAAQLGADRPAAEELLALDD
jgi:hypothetical protein